MVQSFITSERVRSRWGVEVRWGAGPRNGHAFVSDDVSDAGSKAGVKKGHAAAATVAIAGLRDIVDAANSKPTQYDRRGVRGALRQHVFRDVRTRGVGAILGFLE